MDMDVEDDIFDDPVLCGVGASDFEESFSEVLTQGTPRRAGTGQFKVPSSSKTAGKVFHCTKPNCGRAYKTHRGFKAHLKLHNVRDAAVRVLLLEDVKNKSTDIAAVALKRILEMESFSIYSQAFEKLCRDTLLFQDSPQWVDLVEGLAIHIFKCLPTKFNFPSYIRSEFNTNVQYLLVSKDFRCMLTEKHNALGIAHTGDYCSVVWLFLGQFVVQFATEILLLVLRSMREPIEEESSPANQQRILPEQEKLYHYIAGWLVKDCIKRGLRFQENSPKWSRILACIRACFLQSDTVAGPDPEITQWTVALNRGGLTHVGKLALEFFLSIGLIASSMKTMNLADFYTKIFHSRAVTLWDKIIGGSLPSAESIWLMESMCKKFYNMYGRGRSNKERNEHLKHGHANASTRKILARK